MYVNRELTTATLRWESHVQTCMCAHVYVLYMYMYVDSRYYLFRAITWLQLCVCSSPRNCAAAAAARDLLRRVWQLQRQLGAVDGGEGGGVGR